MGDLTIRREETPAALVLHVAGRLGVDQASCWQQELKRVWPSRAPSLVMELSAVTYVDTAGVALLILALQRAEGEGKGFSLVGLNAQAQKVLRLISFPPCLSLPEDPGRAAGAASRPVPARLAEKDINQEESS